MEPSLEPTKEDLDPILEPSLEPIEQDLHDEKVQVASKCEKLNSLGGGDMGESVDRVLRLLSTESKRFLVNKVDRSATALIAQ